MKLRARVEERGQAATLVAVVIVLAMVLIPLAAEFQADEQGYVTVGAESSQLALQAAEAGIADIQSQLSINGAGYVGPISPSYCSSGSFSGVVTGTTIPGCTSTVPGTSNPAFVNQFTNPCTTSVASNPNWVTLSQSAGVNEGYQYIVDSRRVGLGSTYNNLVYVYATGRAGTSGDYTCRTEKAAIYVGTSGNTSTSDGTPTASSIPQAGTVATLDLAGGPGAGGSRWCLFTIFGICVFGEGGGSGGQAASVSATLDLPSGTPLYFGTVTAKGGSQGQSGGGSGLVSGAGGGNAGGGGGGASAICMAESPSLLTSSSGKTPSCNTTTMPLCVGGSATSVPTNLTSTNACIVALAAGGGGGGQACEFSGGGNGGNGGSAAGGGGGENAGGAGGTTLNSSGTGGAGGTALFVSSGGRGVSGLVDGETTSGGQGAQQNTGWDGGGGGGGLGGGGGGAGAFIICYQGGGGGGGGGSSWFDSWVNTGGATVVPTWGTTSTPTATVTTQSSVTFGPSPSCTAWASWQNTAASTTVQVTLTGGGGGSGSVNGGKTAVGGGGSIVTGTYTVPSGFTLWEIDGCGGGTDIANGTTVAAGGFGFNAGGNGGVDAINSTCAGNYCDGGGGGGGSSALCLQPAAGGTSLSGYGPATDSCESGNTLLAVASGGGGGGGQAGSGATAGAGGTGPNSTCTGTGTCNGTGGSSGNSSGGGGGGAGTGSGGGAGSGGHSAAAGSAGVSGVPSANVITGGAGGRETSLSTNSSCNASTDTYVGGGGGGGGYYGGGGGGGDCGTSTGAGGGGGSGSSWVISTATSVSINKVSAIASEITCGSQTSECPVGTPYGVGGPGSGTVPYTGAAGFAVSNSTSTTPTYPLSSSNCTPITGYFVGGGSLVDTSTTPATTEPGSVPVGDAVIAIVGGDGAISVGTGGSGVSGGSGGNGTGISFELYVVKAQVYGFVIGCPGNGAVGGAGLDGSVAGSSGAPVACPGDAAGYTCAGGQGGGGGGASGICQLSSIPTSGCSSSVGPCQGATTSTSNCLLAIAGGGGGGGSEYDTNSAGTITAACTNGVAGGEGNVPSPTDTESTNDDGYNVEGNGGNSIVNPPNGNGNGGATPTLTYNAPTSLSLTNVDGKNETVVEGSVSVPSGGGGGAGYYGGGGGVNASECGGGSGASWYSSALNGVNVSTVISTGYGISITPYVSGLVAVRTTTLDSSSW